MKVIVVVDNEWGIGKNNDLLYKLPLDMKFFKEQTINKVVVMGSNNLLSFKDSKPLKDRVNIVLYPDGEFSDCVCVKSVEELKRVIKKYNTDDVFVIGGAMMYSTMLDYCDCALITKVDATNGATKFFPNLDQMSNWNMVECSEEYQTNGYNIRFCKYINSQVKEM